MPYVCRQTLITHIVDHLLLKLIRQNRKRFRLRRCRKLLQKVDSERVLFSRVVQKDRLGSNVKDAIVALDYAHKISGYTYGVRLGKEAGKERKTYRCFRG